MKITKEQLKQMIKEELDTVQSEQPVTENYEDEKFNAIQSECSQEIGQALANGEINIEEAVNAFGACVDRKRMGAP